MGELASLLGISFEAYRDLEDFDEEIVDCISFDQLTKLADAIGLDLRDFFAAGSRDFISFAELAARLEAVAGDEAALTALEDDVGWEFRTCLSDPRQFGELPAIALAEIGQPVGVDWRSLLPLPAAPRAAPPS